MSTDLTGATSIPDMMRRSIGAFPEKVSHRVPGKGGYSEITFSQFGDLVFRYARALSTLGLKKGDALVILGESSFEWALTDWAAQSLGYLVIPIYPTLPPDQAQYIANDCGAKAAVLLEARLSTKLTGIRVTLLRAEGDAETLLSLEQKSTLTRSDWEKGIDAIDLDDLATLIYTSGTTGQPKGAMLTHRNFVFICQGITKSLPVSDADTFLSFLPLSHVYERVAGHVLPVSLGATIAYAGSLASLANDIVETKPTILPCVPRFLENMRSRILDGVAKQSGLHQRLFRLAISQGLAKQRGRPAPLFPITDRLVGSKVRERMGGRLRLLVSGGAALPPVVGEFYLALGITLLQGYGLTETTAASSLNLPEDNKPWTVGHPIEGVEFKIAADGEILIRGNSVMKGYFNLPEATAQAIDPDGWFHTGDIGEFEGKNIKITDRKKDILVLGNGKNVAPQPVENRLKESPLVNEAVVLGDGMEYCCALIVPEFDRIRSILRTQGVSEPDDQALVQRDDVKRMVKEEVDKANKGLADFERVKKHVLVGKMFTVDDGELTPSLKVRRKVVKERYADEIKSMQRA